MNKTFDIKRLGMVMRWDILTGWKHYAGVCLGFVIAYTIFSLGMLYNLRNQDYCIRERSVSLFLTENGKELYFDHEAGFFTAVTIIGIFVMAACIFKNMRTKTSRESFLMLPANNCEKYVSRFLISSIGTLVLLAIALVATDIIQLAFSFIITPGFHVSITLAVLKHMVTLPIFTRMAETDIVAICCFIFCHSFCTLGGTFYRKRAPLLTFVTGILLMMVIGYALALLAETDLFTLHITINGDRSLSYMYTTISCVFFLALAAANYWASYKIFTRMQVICNKWINI